jgi:DNA-damage-inducible protein D
MNSLENINESLFENIKHINEYGQEYWIARELIQVLGYNAAVYNFLNK